MATIVGSVSILLLPDYHHFSENDSSLTFNEQNLVKTANCQVIFLKLLSYVHCTYVPLTPGPECTEDRTRHTDSPCSRYPEGTQGREGREERRGERRKAEEKMMTRERERRSFSEINTHYWDKMRENFFYEVLLRH